MKKGSLSLIKKKKNDTSPTKASIETPSSSASPKSVMSTLFMSSSSPSPSHLSEKEKNPANAAENDEKSIESERSDDSKKKKKKKSKKNKMPMKMPRMIGGSTKTNDKSINDQVLVASGNKAETEKSKHASIVVDQIVRDADDIINGLPKRTEGTTSPNPEKTEVPSSAEIQQKNVVLLTKERDMSDKMRLMGKRLGTLGLSLSGILDHVQVVGVVFAAMKPLFLAMKNASDIDDLRIETLDNIYKLADEIATLAHRVQNEKLSSEEAVKDINKLLMILGDGMKILQKVEKSRLTYYGSLFRSSKNKKMLEDWNNEVKSHINDTKILLMHYRIGFISKYQRFLVPLQILLLLALVFLLGMQAWYVVSKLEELSSTGRGGGWLHHLDAFFVDFIPNKFQLATSSMAGFLSRNHVEAIKDNLMLHGVESVADGHFV